MLAEAGLTARDIRENFVEDFELINAEGLRVAIVEAKVVNRHTELDADPDDLPGILVVNIFRRDPHLTRRCSPVHERQARHARQMNVLVLRSWDLLQLVVRRLDGHDDSERIAAALLDRSGGWHEVDVDGVQLHDGQ